MKALIGNLRCASCLNKLKAKEIRENSGNVLRHVSLFCDNRDCKECNKLYRLPSVELVAAGTRES